MTEQTPEPTDETIDATAEHTAEAAAASQDEVDDAAAAGQAATEQSLAEQLEATRIERDDAKDRALRTMAELDNFRRRSNDEKAKARKYQSLALARDLLPHIDNLRRAVEAAEDDSPDDGGSVLAGVKMVLSGLESTMASHGVKPVVVEVGTPFDPNVHEALSQVPRSQVPDAEAMTVLQEIERGYTLHEQLIRPSKVIVVGSEG